MSKTLGELLQETKARLTDTSESPYLDAVLLWGHLLNRSRETLLASLPDPINPKIAEDMEALILRRQKGEPIAYIRGIKEFWGLSFRVTPGVLTPRPDSETLVEAALDLCRERNYTSLHDLCTGSGCLAIAVKHSAPHLRVTGSDLSPEALTVAETNSRNLFPNQEGPRFFLSDLLESFHSQIAGEHPRVDIIISNPPYLTANEMKEKKEKKWPEPSMALDGGPDGLDLIRRIVWQAPGCLNPGGTLLMEADPRQMDAIEALLRESNWTKIEKKADLTNRIRVIGAHLP